jgi:hypothetical protein
VPDAEVSYGQQGCQAVEFPAATPGIEAAGQRQGSLSSLLKRVLQVRTLPAVVAIFPQHADLPWST